MPPSLPTRFLRRPLVVAVTVPVLLAMAAPLSSSAAQASSRSARTAVAAGEKAAPDVAQAVPPGNAVLFGLDDHWESDIVADDSQVHARSGIVGTFLAWSEPNMGTAAEASAVVHYSEWARSRGAVPMIDLHPPSGVTLAQIAAGDQDATLNLYAKALAQWNHPFLLRLFPEMNGPWKTYSPGTNGNTTAQFIAAWRHVYTLFHHDGASNVKFIWNPDKQLSHPVESLLSLWPGAAYVDWVGIDVFDREDTAHGTYPDPVTALQPTVDSIHGFTHKPIIIAESGTVTSTRKTAWITELFTGTAALGVKAVVYFNETAVDQTTGAQITWRLNSSTAALAAAKRTLTGTSVAWPGHNGGSLANDEHLMATGQW